MLGFVHYLIQQGYTPYRKVYEHSKFQEIPDNYPDYFSSTVPGYTDVILRKKNKLVIYGLHEYKKPTTLIYPRNVSTDDEMNRIFQTKTFEEIAKELKLV